MRGQNLFEVVDQAARASRRTTGTPSVQVVELLLVEDNAAHAEKVPGQTFDARCAHLSVDQHGRHFATNESGEDSTADCWDRK